jgi:uncharacterized phage protein gp47/JayE
LAQPFFDLGSLGLNVSPSTLLQQWLSSLQSSYPQYQPAQGNLEYVLAQIIAASAADLGQMCVSGGTELFRTFGTNLLQLPYQQGNPAIAVVTVTAQDTAGYTLPAGTQLTLTSAGAPLGFQTSSALTIPNGTTSGTVNVQAVQAGSLFNGAGAPAQLVSTLTWVAGISVTSVASGGTDPEDDTHYLNRLVQTLQLLAPRPITASDYATIAENFTPAPGTDQEEVGRATAIDGYDPGSGTYGNEREVTVCVTDANGNALNSDTLTAIQGYLTGLREVNFIVNVVSPNYTTIYVACQIHPLTGFVGSSVQAAVQAALLSYLSPANWGLAPTGSAGWTNYQTIYKSRLLATIQNVAGVDYVERLKFDVNSHPTNNDDLLLPGAFPLPTSTSTSIPTTGIVLI